MAMTLKELKANIEAFNHKYSTNFDINEYINQAKQKGSNKAYWDTYTNMASNLANRKIAGENLPSLYEMLDDYEVIVMERFRRYCTDNPKEIMFGAPHIYGGESSAKNRALLIKVAFDKKPTYDYQLIAKNYMDGKLRIRDMVAETRAAVESSEPLKTERAIELLKYSLALKEANRQRHALYWLFHPIRNRAEQRDANLIQSLINEKMGGLGIRHELSAAKNAIIPTIKTDMEAILATTKYMNSDIEPERQMLFDEDIKSLHFNDSVFYEDDKIVETTEDKQKKLVGEDNEEVEKLSGAEGRKIKDKVVKSKNDLVKDLSYNQHNIIAGDDFEDGKDLFQENVEKDFRPENIQSEIDKRAYGDDVLGMEDFDDYNPNKGFMDELYPVDKELLKDELKDLDLNNSNDQELEGESLLSSEDEKSLLINEKVVPGKVNEVKEQPKPVIAPKDPAIDNPFLKIGYRPDISSKAKINEYGRYLNNLEKDMKFNWKKYSKAENEVFQVNRRRYESAYGRFVMGTGNQNVFDLEKEDMYAEQDADLRKKFPEYKHRSSAKEEMIGNEERVPIKVDLGENKIQEKVGAVGGESVKIEPPISNK